MYFPGWGSEDLSFSCVGFLLRFVDGGHVFLCCDPPWSVSEDQILSRDAHTITRHAPGEMASEFVALAGLWAVTQAHSLGTRTEWPVTQAWGHGPDSLLLCVSAQPRRV